MSQDDVYQFLKKKKYNNKWYSTEDIRKGLDYYDKRNIAVSLKKMRKNCEVYYKKERRNLGKYVNQEVYVYKFRG